MVVCTSLPAQPEYCTKWLGQSSGSEFGSAQANCWAEAPIQIARMTLTIKLDGNWNSFQLASSGPLLSVTDSAIAPSARMAHMPHNKSTPLPQSISG